MSAIDASIIADLKALDPDGSQNFLGELIGLFLTRTPASLNTIADGIKAGNAKQVYDELHQLVSTSANLGAMRFNGLIVAFEALARAGKLGDAQARLKDISDEYGRAARELQAIDQASVKRVA